jgi:DNA-binding transcriptional regulator YhcF (GntR family)
MQKHLLMTIAAKLTYNGMYRMQFSSDELAQMMSCSVRSIRRLNNELSRMGFLMVEHAFDSEDGAQLPSFYSLTDKISVNPKITKKV